MQNPVNYTLQLRMLPADLQGSTELEVVAQPCQSGLPFHGRFRQWEPVFDNICAWVSTSAFHRKAVQRTLSAGLVADLINRETGSKHLFSEVEIARLGLSVREADILLAADHTSDLSTAA